MPRTPKSCPCQTSSTHNLSLALVPGHKAAGILLEKLLREIPDSLRAGYDTQVKLYILSIFNYLIIKTSEML